RAIAAEGGGDETNVEPAEQAYQGVRTIATDLAREYLSRATPAQWKKAIDPNQALAQFAAVQHDDVLGGPPNLQELLDRFEGFKFENDAAMHDFTERLQWVVQAFRPPLAVFLRGSKHQTPGILRAVPDKGYRYFRVQSN